MGAAARSAVEWPISLNRPLLFVRRSFGGILFCRCNGHEALAIRSAARRCPGTAEALRHVFRRRRRHPSRLPSGASADGRPWTLGFPLGIFRASDRPYPGSTPHACEVPSRAFDSISGRASARILTRWSTPARWSLPSGMHLPPSPWQHMPTSCRCLRASRDREHGTRRPWVTPFISPVQAHRLNRGLGRPKYPAARDRARSPQWSCRRTERPG